MKRDLLEMAIAELKRVHEEKLNFEYSDWGALDDHSCGTVACAGGWLALHKPLQDLGLTYRNAENLVPVFEDNFGYLALAKFFDIEPWQARDTFVYLEPLGASVTALDVANKLQEYLDADAAEGGV